MQKSARFTEESLQKAGTPVVGNETVSLGDVRPDLSWTLERLAVYAKDEVSNSDHAEQQAILQANKSAIHLFRAGHALALARDKCKGEQHGEWTKFKKKHRLAGTTANDAIRLYENAKTEDALAGLGITEAKTKFGIAKPKKSKKGASGPPGPQPPASNPGAGAVPNEAAPDPGHHDKMGGVPKDQPGPVEGQNDKGNTSAATNGSTDNGEKQVHVDETAPTDKASQSLADELERIAQRLSEINQDDFGKATWTKADIRKARNAVAAMNKNALGINRRLNNEDPIS